MKLQRTNRDKRHQRGQGIAGEADVVDLQWKQAERNVPHQNHQEQVTDQRGDSGALQADAGNQDDIHHYVHDAGIDNQPGHGGGFLMDQQGRIEKNVDRIYQQPNHEHRQQSMRLLKSAGGQHHDYVTRDQQDYTHNPERQGQKIIQTAAEKLLGLFLSLFNPKLHVNGKQRQVNGDHQRFFDVCGNVVSG